MSLSRRAFLPLPPRSWHVTDDSSEQNETRGNHLGQARRPLYRESATVSVSNRVYQGEPRDKCDSRLPALVKAASRWQTAMKLLTAGHHLCVRTQTSHRQADTCRS